MIGAGPNGLVAANRLADAGWSVARAGGAATVGRRRAQRPRGAPGFVHDTFSSFYPLAAASPTIPSFDLETHGLVWRHAPAVLGHPLPDGSWALLHRDRDVTARLLDDRHPGDGEAWLRLCAAWDRIGDQLVGRPAHAVPAGAGAAAAGAEPASAGGLDFVKTLLTPVADLGQPALRRATTRGSCSPATPGTRTSRSTPPGPA